MATTARLNPVARERARVSHHRLEAMMAAAVRAAGRTPMWTDQIDLYFQAATLWFVTEMKSCTDDNFQAQVRKGVSQLLEYHQSRAIVGLTAPLLLVVEIPPPARLAWVVNWLESLGILLVWPDAGRHAIGNEAGPSRRPCGYRDPDLTENSINRPSRGFPRLNRR